MYNEEGPMEIPLHLLKNIILKIASKTYYENSTIAEKQEDLLRLFLVVLNIIELRCIRRIENISRMKDYNY
jgi:hypothetical protein